MSKLGQISQYHTLVKSNYYCLWLSISLC